MLSLCYVYTMNKPKWKRVPVLYPVEHIEALERAAAEERISRSSFIVRTCVDAINQDAITGKLYRSQAFRIALSELVTKPDVLPLLAKALGESQPDLQRVREHIQNNMAELSTRKVKVRKPPQGSKATRR